MRKMYKCARTDERAMYDDRISSTNSYGGKASSYWTADDCNDQEEKRS